MKKTLLLSALALTQTVFAAEHPIGMPINKNGLQIRSVYLQPVVMKPMTTPAPKADVHFEADIHALKNNPNGFAMGEWIPYLSISYEVEKLNNNKKVVWTTKGNYMPMVASDGPHYGNNVKLDGIGEYRLTLHIAPPTTNGFLRHDDKETGVDPFWKPFTIKSNFTYLGTGKKGGY